MLSSSVNAKVLEEINLSLNEVNQILDDLMRGGVFYENLFAYLLHLNQTVDDYVMARQAQFADLIQKIDHMIPKKPPSVYQKNKEKGELSKSDKMMNEEKKNDNEEQPKLFFDEDSNKFPLGSSVFVPSKRGGSNYPNESVINVYESTVVQNLSDSKLKK